MFVCMDVCIVLDYTNVQEMQSIPYAVRLVCFVFGLEHFRTAALWLTQKITLKFNTNQLKKGWVEFEM